MLIFLDILQAAVSGDKCHFSELDYLHEQKNTNLSWWPLKKIKTNAGDKHC